MIPGIVAGIAVDASAPSTVTWDPSNTATSITLSNGNRTATGNSNSGGITRSLTSKSSGKWYAEVSLDAYSTAGSNGCGIIGLVTPGEALANYLGQGTGCSGMWRAGSELRKYLSGSSTVVTGSTGVPAIWMEAWDADAGLVWYGRNGTWLESGDPATGANPMQSDVSLRGEHYLATGPRNTGNQTSLLASPTYAIPSGFAYWM